MCGRLNVIDDPFVIELCRMLGIKIWPDKDTESGSTLITGRFIRATNKISLIRQQNDERRMESAIWWLLLDESDGGFKPSRYTSFNTRYDKLKVPKSAGYQAFKSQRCIIPVKGFGETEGKGNEAKYTDFSAKDGALALGGLYRQWINKETGEATLSCSVITLPPHDKIIPYHSKASPLMLPLDSGLSGRSCSPNSARH